MNEPTDAATRDRAPDRTDEVARLEYRVSELEQLVTEMREHLVTKRISVVEDDGFERITLTSRSRVAHSYQLPGVTVRSRADGDGDDTYVEMHASDGTEGVDDGIVSAELHVSGRGNTAVEVSYYRREDVGPLSAVCVYPTDDGGGGAFTRVTPDGVDAPGAAVAGVRS